MRGLNRPLSFATLAVALAGVTCAFPTDKSDNVFVTLEAPSRVVLRGQDMSVFARAWHVVGIDTQPIVNVGFVFSSGSATIARVETNGGGYATVTGVNSGTVDIIARAVAFEGAQPADLVLRVSNPLEIDSVRPAVVHFGEVMTVYGVGVDSMFIASLGGVNLIEYPFSRQRDTTGLGQISFWVPPPARSDKLFYLGAGVFGQATDTTAVIPQDVFEPNDTVPSTINLDLPGPWPGTAYAPILFTNPALAFEPIDRAKTQGADWFRFTATDSTRALTFFITYPSFGDTAATRTFLLDSLYYQPGVDYFGRDSADFIGSDFVRCKGDFFGPAQLSRESTTVALRSLPSHGVHIITFFSRPQRYGLTVAQGYFTADSRIRPDAYEENDMCHYADRPSQRVTVPPSGVEFVFDTLTIDNPFEFDWYRIQVPASGPVDSIVIRTQARPFIAGRDTSDIDLYVLRIPGVSDTTPGTSVMDIVAQSLKPGSSETLVTRLPAGAYYIAVTDFAGVATRYQMCVKIVPPTAPRNCVLPLLPGAPVSTSIQAAPRARRRAATATPFLGPRRRP